MKVILFGATGMVGQGVLRECLLDSDVDEVLVISRTPLGKSHPKVREVVLPDVSELSGIEDELAGYDACFFCLGVSSVGMREPEYRRITYDLAVSVGTTLSRLKPGMTFLYVSGAGTDSSEQGRVMWARVKGATENALLALPLDAYMLRPGYIHPAGGAQSKTRLYRVLYRVTTPLYHLLKGVLPGYLISNDQIGRCMLRLARHGGPAKVLPNPAIHEAARV